MECMQKIEKSASVFLILTLMACFCGFANAAEKLHLRDLVPALRDGPAITKLFKDQAKSKSELKLADALLKKNRKIRETTLRNFEAGTAFVRGEIEDEATLNAVIQLLQLSLIKVRKDVRSRQWKLAQKEIAAWFTFAADFPYEESSLIGLKVAGVIRSFLLDEIETMVKNSSDELAKDGSLRVWFLKVRAPWPIDRMLTSEARRALPPALLGIAGKVAQNLQKNPYITAAEALEQVPGGKPKDLEILKELWKPSHIGDMKAEITRIGKLKMQLAANEYALKTGKKALHAEELVTAKLLDQVPVDYNTGKPMGISTQ